MLKGIIDKLFNSNQPTKQAEPKTISQEEIEALVDAKVKEHAATLQSTLSEQVPTQPKAVDSEEYTLTAKQIDFALALIEKVNGEYELAIEPTQLTIKDLNKLIAYNKYKNKGILINLVKKGVIRKK